MSSIMETIRQKQLEDEQKAQDFRMAKEMEMKMILYSIILDQGKNHNCASSEACPICNAALILKSMADWERFVEPMAKIVCAVSAAIFLLMRVTNGVVGLNSAGWRMRLAELLEVGKKHECDNPLCIIGAALEIAKAIPNESRVFVVATLGTFLTIVDGAAEIEEDMEQENLLHNPN